MSELVDTFLKHKGFIKEKGGTNAPLMPNILADSIYLCWDEHLKGKLKHESKKWANHMINSYHRFNKEFFAGFDKSQIDEGVNAMDDFSEHVKNEVALFRMVVRNRLKGLPQEQKNMISNIALCNFLASQADEMWGIIYKTGWGERDRDNNLYGIYVGARELLNVYTKDLDKEFRGIDLGNDRDIQLAMRRFEAKVMEFIRIWK